MDTAMRIALIFAITSAGIYYALMAFAFIMGMITAYKEELEKLDK